MSLRGTGITRRTLLVGGGVGAGLVLAWSLWPRSYRPNLAVRPGETLFNAFLKIGRDGRVIVAVPQIELGQGVYTTLPQILADELGADWRTVAVEPAPLSPLYANQLIAAEQAEGRVPAFLRGIGGWAAREYATRTAMMMTGGSTSVRAFEGPMRQAGAAARALLSQAAADRWRVPVEELDTAEGFVVHGRERLAFAELAEEAAGHDLPAELPARGGSENRLVGESLPRLDAPAKVDGSALFAGDVRLPDMLFASVRAGPIGDARLARIDRAAGERVPGVRAIVENERFVAAVASNWWAADQAVRAMKPGFVVSGPLADDVAIEAALAGGTGSELVHEIGDLFALPADALRHSAVYTAGALPSVPPEPLTATARFGGGRLEIWAPAQAQGFARAAAARAAGIPEDQVTLYPTLVGGGYGRKLETRAIEQAVLIAREVGRPVQLGWSRSEETVQDSFRPPARASLTAWLDGDGRVAGWRTLIAAPATDVQVAARLRTGRAGPAALADPAAVRGAVPPYAIPSIAIEHRPIEPGLVTGSWRSGADSYTAFFNECFVDELARLTQSEPLSFRIGMLTDNARLARVLSTAATLGGWDGGGPGSRLGIAAHSAFGSHAALLVEAGAEAGSISVTRAVCAVDCGRIIHPEIVRQQIEGAILHGIAGAIGRPVRFEAGLPSLRGLRQMGLPTLADSPEIIVEIVESQEPPGGITELGVPPVAPAIANALYALTGQRLRRLPLVLGAA